MDLSEARFRASTSVHAREFDGELVIVDLHHGDYFGLDEVGARMWGDLVRGKSPREIALALVADYDADEARLLGDVVKLAQDCLGRGLLVQT